MEGTPRADRHLEIERKKQRLAELKAKRSQENEERRQTLVGPLKERNALRSQTPSRQQLDDILGSVGLGFDPIPPPKLQWDAENTDPEAKKSSPVSSVESIHEDPRLALTSVSTVAVPTRETVQYAKCIQTDDELHTPMTTHHFDFDNDETRARLNSVDIEGPLVKLPEQSEEAEEEQKPELPKSLTQEEMSQIASRDDYLAFFHSASKAVERLLAAKREIYTDYNLDNSMSPTVADDLLTLAAQHQDPKWTANRAVTGISFASHHKELVAVAYSQAADRPDLPTGVVCVWNSQVDMTSPEFAFSCNSQLTSVTFARYNPHMILAGCYSGQIALWDHRVVAKKGSSNRPTFQSSRSNLTHTHPIYSIDVVGTATANHVVTTGKDGKYCTWSIENLAQPAATRELHYNSRPLAPLCAAFFADGSDCFVVGAEDGPIFQFQPSTVATNVMQPQKEYNGHGGPLLALHPHPAKGIIDFGHLFLSSGYDWTIRLWSNKDSAVKMCFDAHQDAVVDVKWSPVHPAVFCSIDSSGLLMLWNLNENVDSPVLTISVTSEGEALRKLSWSEHGRQMCVGDAKGSIYIYNVHEVLHSPSNEEFTKFALVLVEIRQQNEDECSSAAM